jgi:hypothetical protein
MRRVLLAALGACLLWFCLPAFAQSGAKSGEWRTYGGDLGSTRYAPLDQIIASNFNKLEVAWRYKTDSLRLRAVRAVPQRTSWPTQQDVQRKQYSSCWSSSKLPRD